MFSIAECKTPKERFLMLLKWYFSAFKTGRKPISKKPYNPIIGEVFQCYYTLPSNCSGPTIGAETSCQESEIIEQQEDTTDNDENDASQVLGGDRSGCRDFLDELPQSGPVPWAGCDDVAFIAEQVSHHPPSAYIFYCYEAVS